MKQKLLSISERLTRAAEHIDVASRQQKIAHMLSYAATDTLSFRDPHDSVLRQRQETYWDPWLNWLEKTHGVTLTKTEGVIAGSLPDFPPAFQRYLERLSNPELLVLGLLTDNLGSMALALAVLAEALSLPDALTAAFLEGDYQAERWGVDEEETKRRVNIAHELQEALAFLHCQRKANIHVSLPTTPSL